jgi:hypothetical protein
MIEANWHVQRLRPTARCGKCAPHGAAGEIPMTILPHLDAETEAALEAMVDKFGLAAVLNGLSCICSAKADHIEENWQDKRTAKAWERACIHLMNEADHSLVKAVS